MKKILLITAGLMAFAANPAMAQDNGLDSGLEGHIGLSMYDNNDLIGVQGRLGYMHDVGSFIIGIEGEVGTSFSEVSETVSDPDFGTLNVDLGIDSNAAIYGVFRSNRDSQFGLIGRLGYHSTKFGTSVSGAGVGNVDVDLTASGFAGGVGIDYAFGQSRRNVVRLDATYLDLGDFDIDDGLTVIALSYGRRF